MALTFSHLLSEPPSENLCHDSSPVQLQFEFLMKVAADVGELTSMGGGPLGERRVVSQGYRHGPPEVLAALGRGEEVPPQQYFFRTVMRFETGDRGLQWLNRCIAVATAQRKARQVLLEVYRLL